MNKEMLTKMFGEPKAKAPVKKAVKEDVKKARVFQSKEQALEFIKKYVPDIVEPYPVSTKSGWIIKYIQDGFMKTLYEDDKESPEEQDTEGLEWEETPSGFILDLGTTLVTVSKDEEGKWVWSMLDVQASEEKYDSAEDAKKAAEENL